MKMTMATLKNDLQECRGYLVDSYRMKDFLMFRNVILIWSRPAATAKIPVAAAYPLRMQ